MIERHYEPVLRRLLRRFPVRHRLGAAPVRQDDIYSRRAYRPGPISIWNGPPTASPLAADARGPPDPIGRTGLILRRSSTCPRTFPGFARRHRPPPRLRGVASCFWDRPLPRLYSQISESLAGSHRVLGLASVSLERGQKPTVRREISRRYGFAAASQKRSWTEMIVRAIDWLESYTRSFIERDLPALGIERFRPADAETVGDVGPL